MKKNIITIAVVVIVVALLGGAAFMVGRQTAGSPASTTDALPEFAMGPDGGPPLDASGNPMPGSTMRIEMAPELHDREPDAMGPLVRVTDYSIFVGSGGMMLAVTTNVDGEADVEMPSGADSGDETEVVVTKETLIYRDALQFPQMTEGGKMPETMQQEVALITLSEVGTQGAISAWGQKRGDRLIAEVVLYMGF